MQSGRVEECKSIEVKSVVLSLELGTEYLKLSAWS